ncbi:hypothetical protein [Nocardioides nanhaiensis]
MTRSVPARRVGTRPGAPPTPWPAPSGHELPAPGRRGGALR